MKGHLDAARLDFPETSHLRPAVDALVSSMTQGSPFSQFIDALLLTFKRDQLSFGKQ